MKGCRIVVTCREIRGHCGAGMQVGDRATFDGVRIEGTLCIHAMASMMSKIFAMHQGVQFRWLKDPNVATHLCPDAANPVTYELRREPLTGTE